MNLLSELFLGGFMIGITVIMHAMGLDFIIKHAKGVELVIYRISRRLWKPIMASVIVVGVFIIHTAQIWLWAVLYSVLDTTKIYFSEILYFSTVTYTTLGSDSFPLDPSLKVLSGIEGANGFLLFGWTAAFIFEVISQLYKREARDLT